MNSAYHLFIAQLMQIFIPTSMEYKQVTSQKQLCCPKSVVWDLPHSFPKQQKKSS